MRSFFLTFALLVVANFLHAQGIPPFYTDDTATVSKRQWELDIGFSTERSRGGDYSWTAPSVGLAFGLTDALELDYGTSWLGLRPVDEHTKYGLGNSIAGVKWRFFEDKASGFSLSINPYAEFNNRASSHRRGLVERGTEVVLPFQVARRFGEINTAFDVGRSFHSRDRRESDGWLAGIVAGRKIAGNLSAGLEVYGETSRDFERGWLVFNLGAYYEVNDWLSFSASAGRGFAGADRPDYVAFFGLQLLR
jgi:hypothetical protein